MEVAGSLEGSQLPSQGSVPSSLGVVTMAGMAGYEQPNAYSAPQVTRRRISHFFIVQIERFILVTREQLLLEVIHDNSNGFPTRCSVQILIPKKKLIQFLPISFVIGGTFLL